MTMEPSTQPPTPPWPTCQRLPRATSTSITICRTAPCSSPSRTAMCATALRHISTRATKLNLSCRQNVPVLETTSTAHHPSSYPAHSLPRDPKLLSKLPMLPFTVHLTGYHQAKPLRRTVIFNMGCPATPARHLSCTISSITTRKLFPKECKRSHPHRFLQLRRVTGHNRRRHILIMAVELTHRRMGRHRTCKAFHMAQVLDNSSCQP